MTAEPRSIFTANFSGPFADDFRAFAAADRAAAPPLAPILLYGSSTIRLWTSLAQDFPHLPLLNRGFGGATLGDCVHHFFSLVEPYAPSKIIFYAGDNDLDQWASPEEVRDRFAELLRRIRFHCGPIPVVFIAIKSSPARWGNVQNIRRANVLIDDLIATEPGTAFLDFTPEMLLPDGSPDPSFYQEDRLHLSEKGYALWQRLLTEAGHLPPPAMPLVTET